LCGEAYPPPLGWSLSEKVQHDIDSFLTPQYRLWQYQDRTTQAQQRAYAKCVADHRAALDWLAALPR
jgi:hypothetical protein